MAPFISPKRRKCLYGAEFESIFERGLAPDCSQNSRQANHYSRPLLIRLSRSSDPEDHVQTFVDQLRRGSSPVDRQYSRPLSETVPNRITYGTASSRYHLGVGANRSSESLLSTDDSFEYNLIPRILTPHNNVLRFRPGQTPAEISTAKKAKKGCFPGSSLITSAVKKLCRKVERGPVRKSQGTLRSSSFIKPIFKRLSKYWSKKRESHPSAGKSGQHTDRVCIGIPPRTGESGTRVVNEAISIHPETEALPLSFPTSPHLTSDSDPGISDSLLDEPVSRWLSAVFTGSTRETISSRPGIFTGSSEFWESATDFTTYSTFTMEPSRVSRFLDPTSAMAAITKHKAEAIRLAREQGTAVREMCRRAKTETPPYEFEELIGKGAYGRVYKGHQLPSRQVVAIKVLDIDSLDYKSVRDFKDESIKDFIHETKVMKQVKDAGAKNINLLIEAVSIHSQLWLVCEYCPGGSVRTLMRATNDRLDEKFIIPISRELAAGLRAIHDAGIIHRDIKAGNVLIHEEGRLQICDFGVAGVLQSHMDKRSTWIGTPHWMPPEMFSTVGQAPRYGSEIDVWAYGCTLFEFATGNPPNANLRERMQIGRQLNRKTPKLADSDKYSEGLKDLVSFSLDSDPATRPTMADIMLHHYIANSEEEYPTSSLSELVRMYYQWSQRGGQRASLFHPGGAAAAELPGVDSDVDEDWNFSTTDDFERRFSVIDLDQLAASLAELEQEINSTGGQSPQETPEESAEMEMTEQDKVNFDERVRRGAAAMEGLFDEGKPSYKYETKNDFVPVQQKAPVSDLPLRTETDRSSVTSTFIDIDIGAFDSSHYAAGTTTAQPFQLADADTIRANRSSGRQNRSSNEGRSRSSSGGVSSSLDSQDQTYQLRTGARPPTMDWKFPTFMQPTTEELEHEPEPDSGEAEYESEAELIPDTKPFAFDPADKRATMEWTFPVMTASTNDDSASQDSDVDISRHATLKSSDTKPKLGGEPRDSRPSTSASAQSSISTSSDTDYDPFRFDRPATPPDGLGTQQQPLDNHDYPELLTSTDYNDYVRTSLIEGPGPDEEDDTTSAWQNNADATEPVPYTEPFPAAMPSKEIDLNRPFTNADESPTSEPVPTARYDPPVTSAEETDPVQFPDIIPPRLEVLMEGAGETAVTAELDRLLGDFLDALSATGEALSRTKVGSAGRSDGPTPMNVE